MADKNAKFETSQTEEFRKIRMKRHSSYTASAHHTPKARKKKKGNAKKILLVLVVFLALILLAAFCVFSYFKYIHKPVSNTDFFKPSSDTVLVDDKGEPVPVSTLRDSRYNFLAVGCDRREWLSDVIMLATYDVKEKSVSIMQIPRDTYVTVTKKLQLDDNGSISSANFDGKSGYGCKINSVLGHGGGFAGTELKRIAGLAKEASSSELNTICKESFLDIDAKTLKSYVEASGNEKSDMEYKVKLQFAIRYLSALLYHCYGFPVDFYAQVNLDGFVNIVDAIGGVDVFVQEDMNYDDPYQDLHIHIKAGQQHLDGKAAEGFIRFRYGYAAADIARIDAQKIFMTAFIKKLMSLDGIMNINDLVKEISANLNTNISLSDTLYFATNALDLDLTKVVMLTMPGTPQYVSNVSYYLVNKQGLLEYINTYLNKYTEPLTEDDLIIVRSASKNTSRDPLSATDITNDQPDLGFMHSSSKKKSTTTTSQPTAQPETVTATAPEESVVTVIPEASLPSDEPEGSELPTTDSSEDEPLFILPVEEQPLSGGSAGEASLPDGLTTLPENDTPYTDMDDLMQQYNDQTTTANAPGEGILSSEPAA